LYRWYSSLVVWVDFKWVDFQVGILTMAGKGVELLVSPTDDVGKLLGCLHSVKVEAPPLFRLCPVKTVTIWAEAV
jgi:hypothetical protein